MNDLILSPISLTQLEELIRKCVREVLHEHHHHPGNKVEEDEFLTAAEAAKFLKVSLV